MTNLVQCCANCGFWIAGGPKMATLPEAEVRSAEIGNCTVNPPTPVVMPRRDYAATVFAQTHGSRLCGQWVSRFGADEYDGADGAGSADPAGSTVVAFDPARRRRGDDA